VVWVTDERVRLARSQADLNRRRARASSEISSLCFRSNSFLKCSNKALSKSSPPKWVSPAVALTAKTPPVIESNETSNVPPPKSKMRTSFSFFDLVVASSSPYAIAAAVGSLMIRSTSRPAINPASYVVDVDVDDVLRTMVSSLVTTQRENKGKNQPWSIDVENR
jgi:hypothetical protein